MTQPYKTKILFDESARPAEEQEPELTAQQQFASGEDFLPDVVEEPDVDEQLA